MIKGTENWLIIFNPEARNGQNKPIADKTARLLSAEGVRHELVETTSLEHGLELASNSSKDGYTRVVAIGGDGTAHHIANGAIAARIPFGLIPAGSGNDFAGAIGLDSNPEYAVNALIRGRKQSINVVKVTTRAGIHYSINMVDAGIGAQVARAARTQFKWLYGPIRYNLISLRTILTHRNRPSMVTLDQGAPQTMDLTMVICGFGQTAAAGMHFLPDARYTSDKMHGCLIFNAGKLEIVKALRKVWRAEHAEMTDIVKTFTASRVTVETIDKAEPFWVESDGEVRGRTKAVMEAMHRGLEVYVPKDFSLSERSRLVKQL